MRDIKIMVEQAKSDVLNAAGQDIGPMEPKVNRLIAAVRSEERLKMKDMLQDQHNFWKHYLRTHSWAPDDLAEEAKIKLQQLCEYNNK